MTEQTKTSKRGRPSIYTEELVNEICKAIACSNRGLDIICEENPHLPCSSTIYGWMLDKEDFLEKYIRAKRIQTIVGQEEILAIADNSSYDTKITDSGKPVADSEWIARSTLRVKVRQWQAERLMARYYGNKLQAEVTGKDGAPINPPIISVTWAKPNEE